MTPLPTGDGHALEGRAPAPPAATRTSLLAVAGLTLVTALAFHRALAGGVFVYSDFSQMFEPLRSVLREGFEAGEGTPGASLLWSSRLGNGSPVLANPLHAALYPPLLLIRIASPSSVGRLLTVLAIAHLLWGAIGAWLLARRFGREPSGAWVAAIVFGFCGLSISAIASQAIATTSAWLPWLVLAGERLSAPRGRLVAALVLALVVALMIVAGDPFVILAGLGLLGFLQFTGDAAERRSRHRILALLGGIAAGIVLASPSLGATYRYLPASVRAAGFQPAGIVQWSFHPLEFLGFLVPGAFGDANLRGLPSFWGHALVPGRDHELFVGLYLGALAIALAVGGTIRPERRDRLLLLWMGVLLLLALGRYGPLYPLLVHLPGGDALRYPVKWLAPAMLGVALMAGRGVAALCRPPRTFLVIVLVVLASTGIVATAAMAGLDRIFAGLALLPSERTQEVESLTDLIRATLVQGSARSALPLIGLFGAAAFFIRAGRSEGRAAARALGWLAAILVTADLTLANPRLAPVAPESFYRDVPAAARAILDDPQGHGRLFTEEPWDAADLFVDPPLTAVDYFFWQRQTLQIYAAASYRLDLAFNIDIEAFSTLHYARLRALLDGAPLREKLMLLGASGATHLITHRPLADPHLRAMAVYPGRMERPLRLFRNLLAVPRARVVPDLTAYRGNAGFIEAVRRAPDDLFTRTTLVEEADLGPAMPPRPRASESPPMENAKTRSAEILRDAGSELVIRVNGPGGILVISDVLAPGWFATVDGRPAPIVRADYAFRAVPVPAGEHDVVMRYFPWSRS